MTEAEAIHRAWMGIWIGMGFLALAGLQLWTGKTITKRRWISQVITRKAEPGDYWFTVTITVATGLSILGMAISRII